MRQLLQGLHHMPGREGIQPSGGLVQQTHCRICQQLHTQRQSAFFSATDAF